MSWLAASSKRWWWLWIGILITSLIWFSPRLYPDHPFYWVNMVKDRVRLSLADQAGEARLSLQLAQLRFAASQYLLRQSKTKLSVSTVTKAVKYLEKSWLILTQTNNEQIQQDLSESIYSTANDFENVLIDNQDKYNQDEREVLRQMLAKLDWIKTQTLLKK